MHFGILDPSSTRRFKIETKLKHGQENKSLWPLFLHSPRSFVKRMKVLFCHVLVYSLFCTFQILISFGSIFPLPAVILATRLIASFWWTSHNDAGLVGNNMSQAKNDYGSGRVFYAPLLAPKVKKLLTIHYYGLLSGSKTFKRHWAC